MIRRTMTTNRDIINTLSNEDLAEIIAHGDILNMACIDYRCEKEDNDEFDCVECIKKFLESPVDETEEETEIKVTVEMLDE